MILPLFQEVKMATSLSAQGAKGPQALSPNILIYSLYTIALTMSRMDAETIYWVNACRAM